MATAPPRTALSKDGAAAPSPPFPAAAAPPSAKMAAARRGRSERSHWLRRGGRARTSGSGGRPGSCRRRAPTFRADAAPDYEGNRETAERWARVIRCLARGETPPRNERPNHAKELVSGLSLEQWDGIVTVSGDGLVYEVVNGLLSRPDWALALRVPLGVLPCGSGNGLAAAVNCHAGLSPALGVSLLQNCSLLLCRGSAAPLDVLSVSLGSGPRLWSVLAVAWGLVAEADVGSERLRRLGPARFLLAAAARLLVLSARRARLAYLPALEGTENGMDRDNSASRDTQTRRGTGIDLPTLEGMDNGMDRDNGASTDTQTRLDNSRDLPALEGTENGMDRDNGTGRDTQTWLDKGTDLPALESTENRMDTRDTQTRLGTGTDLPALEGTENGMDRDNGANRDTQTQLDNGMDLPALEGKGSGMDRDNGAGRDTQTGRGTGTDLPSTQSGMDGDNGVENMDNGMENTDNGMENADNVMENTDNGMENADNGVENMDNEMENVNNGMENTNNGMENSDNGMENSDNGMDPDNEGFQDIRTGLRVGTEPPALDKGMGRDNRTNRDAGPEPDRGHSGRWGPPRPPGLACPAVPPASPAPRPSGTPPGTSPGTPTCPGLCPTPGSARGTEGWGDPAGLGDPPNGGGDPPELGGSPRRGPEDDLLVPLGQPLPPGWVTLEGDFVLVVALSPSHLGADLVAAPRARPDDGLLHLLFVRGGVSRGSLLRALLAMARGGDPGGGPGTPLSRVPARAFRLEPLGGGGTMTVDGERVPCGPVQGQLHPGLARAIMALPPK
ncbi:LOW QUALITY PROTEIN: sphingosine kinase 2-like [Myiozetetes cayanensis]|uniref:LOW QUALITY PROTEIN: sphingosine kinase 2-like n=1 Tax=Myiozetetes cayanensis TaxID=478635 RepID=UPI00215F6017|nr:LOW QUALITY PROTEIN: sphingosine kinase 2-like [Myiozetetes cayanensis]